MAPDLSGGRTASSSAGTGGLYWTILHLPARTVLTLLATTVDPGLQQLLVDVQLQQLQLLQHVRLHPLTLLHLRTLLLLRQRRYPLQLRRIYRLLCLSRRRLPRRRPPGLLLGSTRSAAMCVPTSRPVAALPPPTLLPCHRGVPAKSGSKCPCLECQWLT